MPTKQIDISNTTIPMSTYVTGVAVNSVRYINIPTGFQHFCTQVYMSKIYYVENKDLVRIYLIPYSYRTISFWATPQTKLMVPMKKRPKGGLPWMLLTLIALKWPSRPASTLVSTSDKSSLLHVPQKTTLLLDVPRKSRKKEAWTWLNIFFHCWKLFLNRNTNRTAPILAFLVDKFCHVFPSWVSNLQKTQNQLYFLSVIERNLLFKE